MSPDTYAALFLIAVAVGFALPSLLIRALVYIEARDNRWQAESDADFAERRVDEWFAAVDQAVAITCAEPIYAELAVKRLRAELDAWGETA
ncbi:hypothetical protein FB382_004358 [Nocardioides ginsengisegetis]|uniref:Uncharacterized protein n=1 Tax=Nocardioides ginsengisegetis TaxID=661491 RepID=A0A7W3PC02_9ACTN|nr:hypothetical protein [Nocardioides ginsengisegetis]MBA8805583.1 hypothetical protein [Nocardioides ginsengisegetis]MBA8806007.1 hypothetical protein [Nocardioides ginsengisegetis]